MKTSLWHLLTLAFVTALALPACTNKVTDHVIIRAGQDNSLSDQDGGPSDEDEKETTETLVGTFSQKIRADKLVASAEQLMSPISFFFADEILDEALKADPTNRMATFYKNLLAPMMKLRGLLTRIDQSPEEIRVHFAQFDIYRRAQGGLKEFLSEPAPGFKTEADVRALVEEIYLEQGKLADYIKKNKNYVGKVTLPHVFNRNDLIERCSVDRTSPLTYRVNSCAYLTYTYVKVNRGDWEAMLQIWNGLRLFGVLSSAYDWNGLAAFSQAREGVSRSEREDAEILKSIPGLGKLRTGHHLSEGAATLSDIHQGLSWLISMQGYFCNPEQHKGHLFVVKGLCLNLDRFAERQGFKLKALVDVIGLSLAGTATAALELDKPFEGRQSLKPITKVGLNPAVLFNKPLPDLKVLLAVEFDGCGHGSKLGDETLGGLFTEGNASEFVTPRRDSKCRTVRGEQE